MNLGSVFSVGSKHSTAQASETSSTSASSATDPQSGQGLTSHPPDTAVIGGVEKGAKNCDCPGACKSPDGHSTSGEPASDSTKEITNQAGDRASFSKPHHKKASPGAGDSKDSDWQSQMDEALNTMPA